MNEKITTQMISRRKALSLLGLGAALGFTLSSALEPLEAEAQEATGTAAVPGTPSLTSMLTAVPGADVLPVFSPDGTKVMWTSSRDGRSPTQLYIADFKMPKE